MTFNAANRKDVRRREKQAKFNERTRLETMKSLMGTMYGRQWVYNLLMYRCHLFDSSFSVKNVLYDTAYLEGERNIGLQIYGDVLAACPDEYIQMMREANVRDLSERAATERSRSEDDDWGDQVGDTAPDEPAGDPDSFAETG